MALQLAGRRVALAVGIIILAVGTVAAISFVKQRGEAARHDEMTKVADARLKQLEKEGADTPASEEAPAKGAEERAPVQDSAESVEAAQPSVEELPQTGVSILAVVPVGVVAFVVASYMNSRRLLQK